MNAFPILVAVLCILSIAYRYYSAWIAAKVCVLEDSRVTPAHRLNDGQNFHPTHRWILFGHHFAAISGAGPLIGPVLAAQFGYLPGLLWLLVGVVLAGAVQDFVVLVASMRLEGRSLAQVVREELGRGAGIAAGVAILFVLVVALAGLGIVVVNALAESAWGVFTIASTIPIALFMGVYLYRFRKGRVLEASFIGCLALIIAVVMGRAVVTGPMAHWFVLSKGALTLGIASYGFLASVLPVWVLLCPRDYLSSFLKIGTIALLVLAVLWVNPELKLPAITPYIHGGGPIIPGKVFPFVFITIMCGAVSGFHALVASGTTPKMIGRESDARMIGYGCMLIEGLVGIVALLAVASLSPGDYFAINVPAEKFETLKLLGYDIDELPVLESQVEEKVQGRTGGAVSLAMGMAKILSSLPGLDRFLAYWFHFAIMFEALFILTTIDTGTRIARFVVQELLGKISASLGKMHSVRGSLVASFLTVVSWGYLIYTGSVATLWPMFGIANQLLAVIALAVASSTISRTRGDRLALVTLLPMAFVLFTTTSGAYELIFYQFFPRALAGGVGSFQAALNVIMTVSIYLCACVVILEAIRRYRRRLHASREFVGGGDQHPRNVAL